MGSLLSVVAVKKFIDPLVPVVAVKRFDGLRSTCGRCKEVAWASESLWSL